MPNPHRSKVVQCPICKQTKIMPSHSDVIRKTDIPICEVCKKQMTFMKKATVIDWIEHPKDIISLQTKKIKTLFNRKF